MQPLYDLQKCDSGNQTKLQTPHSTASEPHNIYTGIHFTSQKLTYNTKSFATQPHKAVIATEDKKQLQYFVTDTGLAGFCQMVEKNGFNIEKKTGWQK